MAALLVLLTVAVVVVLLSRAFRAGAGAEAEAEADAALEESKLVKYRELRELELDWRTGKVSQDDYEQTRAQLRSEAAALLAREPQATDAARSQTNGSIA